MSILYERTLPQGPVVRIRRVPGTPAGVRTGAVCAVIEVDRRVGTARENAADVPPALMAVEGNSEDEVVASLLPFAEDDAAVARLLAARGIR
jgi:hypothetical protein